MSAGEQFPVTGDQVRATHRMRAWENEHERGADGVWVETGQVALVLHVRHVGRTRSRVWLLVNDRIAMFSCRSLDLPRNWRVVSRLSPTSPGP
jgi:hypothetical protein